MRTDRFQRASEVFLEARRCEPARRDALVLERCGTDIHLASEVRRLLEGDAESPAGGGLSAGTGAIGAALRAAAEQAFDSAPRSGDGFAHGSRDASIGRQIGRYRLLHRIGEGGMGAVYLAEQENPKRRVAIKIIRPGVVSPSLLRRFEHEAHVLGRLQHPGIAQIFEAGTHDVGEGEQPFFAMEYVDGVPLSVIGRKDDLSTRDRLELLARIADAVEHAHQRGVIHRDLKPGNILVVEQVNASDRLKPVCLNPKVLDFGVARAIDSDVQATTLHTVAGQIIGTVAYMSPEQAAGNPDDIDTRSDVYALGVIGYELLAGKPPHDLSKRTVPDALRTILETDATTLGQVDRNLRGDVETIIARAMEKDRGRRYQSAAEFAADIRRYLRDEPILARPPSTMYQLSKFARRNKALVGGVATAFLLLILGIVGTSIGLTRALNEAHKARRMNEYLSGMLGWLDPSEVQGSEITLRAVLEEATQRLERDFANEPEITADLRNTLGNGYLQIGDLQVAEQHFREALEARQRIYGEHDPRVADVWNNLGMALRHQEKWKEAEEAHRAALEIRRERLGDGYEVAESLNNLGVVLLMRGSSTGAEELLREALDIQMRLKPGGSQEAAQGLNNLAHVLRDMGNLPEAMRLMQAAVDMRQNLGLSEDISFANMLASFAATAIHFGGDPAEVIPFLQRSLDIRRRLLPPDHPDIASALENLGTLYRSLGRFDLAIDVMSEALALRQRTLPATDPELFRCLFLTGDSFLGAGRPAEAQVYAEEALKVHEATGMREAESIRPRTLLARCYAQQGRHAEAAAALERVLPAAIAEHGATSRSAKGTSEELISEYRAMGENAKAEALASRMANP